MVKSRVQIAADANAASVRAARERRFIRQSEEMAAHPRDLSEHAQRMLAEALYELGWVVHIPA